MIRGLSLCAGIGGLDLGLRLALGVGYRTVGFVEREAFAAAVLVARMEDASLDLAPVWSDLVTFPGRAWRGAVDLVSAGFPCQPWSVAGQKRERVFILAHSHEHGREVLRSLGLLHGERPSLWDDAHGRDEGMADAERGEVREQPGRRNGAGRSGAAEPGHVGSGMGHAECSRASADAARSGPRHPACESSWPLGSPNGQGRQGPGHSRPQWQPFPPGPSDAEGWRDYIGAGGPEPAIRRGPDGLPSRMDELRAFGNAVVPAQAALAFRVLSERVMGFAAPQEEAKG